MIDANNDDDDASLDDDDEGHQISYHSSYFFGVDFVVLFSNCFQD